MTVEEMKLIKKQRGISTNKLSELSGVPVGTLQKILNGETKCPRYATIKALEEALIHETVTYDFRHQGERAVREELKYDSFAHASKYQSQYTVEDYYKIPEERRVELIDGVIYDMSAPTLVHQDIVAEVAYLLKTQIKSRKGGCKVYISPIDVRIDQDNKTMVQPDVMILCDNSKLKRKEIFGAPDFCLEVISPSSRLKDSVIKLNKYILAGVKEYWIVDPIKKMLYTYSWKDEYIPHIYPLEGELGLDLYDGEIKVDLYALADLIVDYPEE